MKIKKFVLFPAGTILLFFLSNTLNFTLAHPDESPRLVPQQEQDLVQTEKGPKENQFIESVQMLGSVALDNEFISPKGRILRAREITILPNGVVAVHQHNSRPGIAYVLEGELIEYRNDATLPITRSVGAAAFEKTGVTHWWVNKSSSKAKILVIDIVLQE